MELQYTICDPTKNITLLVSTPVPRAEQASVAAELMNCRPAVEQVGFLEPPTLPGAVLRLQMMGEEFCGNASISAAAYVAARDNLGEGDVPLEVSGYDGLLHCHLDRRDGALWGTVSMPLPEKLEAMDLPGVGLVPVVSFHGIVHCIVPTNTLTRLQAEAAIRPLNAVLKADACGILLFDHSQSSFAPLIHVASTDTSVWESGCGSGSAAIGAYLTSLAKSDLSVNLYQPGGVISVSVLWKNDEVSSLSITGRVEILEEGVCTL